MIHYVVVSTETGLIESSNAGYELPPASALPPGRKAVATNGELDGRSHRYLDGDLVNVGASPSEHHRYDMLARRWALDADAAWAVIRSQRDRLLARTDWVALRAADRGEPVPPEWLAYRQALRDVTEQQDPLNIAWPVAPAA